MERASSTRGHCVVCGIEGRSRRDFICEDCGDPCRVIIFCDRCRTRTAATPEALEVLRRHAALDLPRPAGVTVKLSNCSDCILPDEMTSTTVFTIRTPSN